MPIETLLQAMAGLDTGAIDTEVYQTPRLLVSQVPGNQMSWFPIHYAVSLCQEAMFLHVLIRIMQQDPAYLRQKTGGGHEAIHLAILQGRSEQVLRLLAADVSPHALTDSYETPLYLAVIRHAPQLIIELLALGADPLSETSYGDTPLAAAIRLGHMQSVYALFEAPLTKRYLSKADKIRLIELAFTSSQVIIAYYLLMHPRVPVEATELSVDIGLLAPASARLLNLLQTCQTQAEVFNEPIQQALLAHIPGTPLTLTNLPLFLIAFSTVYSAHERCPYIWEHPVYQQALLRLQGGIDRGAVTQVIENCHFPIMTSLLPFLTLGTQVRLEVRRVPGEPAVQLRPSPAIQTWREQIMTNLTGQLLYPRYTSVVFQGGGVKGASYLTALEHLIHTRPDLIALSKLERVGGTSAGAITALLIALGYQLEDIRRIVLDLDFSTLLEPELRDTFFEYKATLDRPGGISEFVGTTLYQTLLSAEPSDFEGLLPKLQLYLAVGLGGLSDQIAPLDKILESLFNHIAWRLGHVERNYLQCINEAKALITKLTPFLQKIKESQGLFAGEVLRQKFVEWIVNKGLNPHITFRELHYLAQSSKQYKDLYVMAYDRFARHTQMFSYETTPHTAIADAVRSSMSIQLFFSPHPEYIVEHGVRLRKINGSEFFDGGGFDNYILSEFNRKKYCQPLRYATSMQDDADATEDNPQVLGFRLLEPDIYEQYVPSATATSHGQPSSDDSTVISLLKDVLLSVASMTKQESDLLREPELIARTVFINTLDVGPVDFDMSEAKKESLLRQGTAGATQFLVSQGAREAASEYTAHYSIASPYAFMPPGRVVLTDGATGDRPIVAPGLIQR